MRWANRGERNLGPGGSSMLEPIGLEATGPEKPTEGIHSHTSCLMFVPADLGGAREGVTHSEKGHASVVVLHFH